MACSYFLKEKKQTNLMHMSILTVCLRTACLPGTCRGQERVSDLLELELQVVHLGSGRGI